MKSILNKYKSRYLRRIVSSKDYSYGRLNYINDNIQYWKGKGSESTTLKGKEYCLYMLNLYLKRYNYYINK